jgi:hypothetical protein
MAHHVNIITRKHKMTISSTKTKSIAMCGNHIERVKIVVNGNIIEQVTGFKYLGYRISEYKRDLEGKLQTYKKNKRSYAETFWGKNGQRNKIKNS